jgi:hypothetical protein
MESAAISVDIDLFNPGQFFACCGLLEFADRLWDGAEAWFESGYFFLRPVDTTHLAGKTLRNLIDAIALAPLQATDAEDEMSSPIEVLGVFKLRLDWWNEESARKGLKPWAGSMRSVRIAIAMQSVMRWEETQDRNLLNYATIVYDPGDPKEKVEPFYFDARRGSNALPLDVGFSPDPLKVKSLAYPAVEFLCLAGLQRFRPRSTRNPRVFEYFAWSAPLATCVAPLAVCGVHTLPGDRGFRFANSFRTDQRKHKGFSAATPFVRGNNE